MWSTRDLRTSSSAAAWTRGGPRGSGARSSRSASGEAAAQFGSIGADTIRAWASHWTAGFTFGDARGTPRVFGEYNYASGDDNHHDGLRQTFDQLYATGHDKFGLADQVGWRNIH